MIKQWNGSENCWEIRSDDGSMVLARIFDPDPIGKPGEPTSEQRLATLFSKADELVAELQSIDRCFTRDNIEPYWETRPTGHTGVRVFIDHTQYARIYELLQEIKRGE